MHYANYIKEREGYECVHDLDGFMTYTFVGEACYIRDLYVVPEKRKTKAASRYLAIVTEIAKQKGSKRLLGSVKPSTNGSTVSLKAILAVGFELIGAEQDAIYFKKEF